MRGRLALVLALLAALMLSGAAAARFVAKKGGGNAFAIFHFGEVFFGRDLLAALPPAVGAAVAPASRGYDGQFAFLVAADPLDRRGFSCCFDASAYRWQRWLVPMMARTVALGRDENLAHAFLAVNMTGILALVCVAWRAKRPWLLANPALPLALLFGLNEIWLVVFLGVAVLALAHRRSVLAALAASLAVLCHESAVIGACGLILAELAGRRKPSAWLGLPFAVLALNQALIFGLLAGVPVLGRQGGLGLPFAGFMAMLERFAGDDASRWTTAKGLFPAFGLAVVVGLILLNLGRMRTLLRREGDPVAAQGFVQAGFAMLLGVAVVDYPASSLRVSAGLFLATALWPGRQRWVGATMAVLTGCTLLWVAL